MYRELLIFLCVTSTYGAKIKYDQYKVYTLAIDNINQANVLELAASNPSSGFDFWKSPILGRNAEIMVPPHKLADFHHLVQSINISCHLKIENVQSLIDHENPANYSESLTWNAYYNLEKIYTWLDEKLAKHPKILTNLIVGKSFQGRDIRAVLLSHKPDNPLIFIESNIHAREWITSATATWFLNELLTSQNASVKNLAENFNWIIIPVFNVDGFAFTHKTNRLWRKTRQPHSNLCTGADPNRNFNFKWMFTGASSNPCSENYAGPKPFSEPETLHLANFVQKYRKNLKIYLAFHSFGQYFMFPYGYTAEKVDNYDTLMDLANVTADAISIRYGTDYLYGTSSTTLYETSGTSVDWFYDKLDIKITYTFEFRDRRGGYYGFLLPSNQIIPNCLEIMDGMIAFVNRARILHKV